jgi:hypothetical protein
LIALQEWINYHYLLSIHLWRKQKHDKNSQIQVWSKLVSRRKEEIN